MWLTSLIHFLVWMAPVVLMGRLAFALPPVAGKGTGLLQLFSAGALMFLSVLFGTWWFVNLGRAATELALVAHLVFTVVIVLMSMAGFTVISRLREKGFYAGVDPGERAVIVPASITFLFVLPVVLFGISRIHDTLLFLDLIVYSLDLGLLASLYWFLGYWAGTSSSAGRRKRHRLIYVATGLLFVDNLMRAYQFADSVAPALVVPLRILRGAAGLLIVAFVFVSLYPYVTELIRTTKGELAPHERRRSETNKLLATAFSVMVVFVGVLLLIMLESIYSDEKSIETAYLAQQDRVAQSISSSVGSLTGEFVDILRKFSTERSVQEMDIAGMRRLFGTLPPKWKGSIRVVFRFDEQGKIIFTYPRVPVMMVENASGWLHLSPFLRDKELYVDAPSVNPLGYKVFEVDYPVFRSFRDRPEKFAGGVGLLMAQSTFAEGAFRNISMLSPNVVVALNSEGEVVAESRGEHAGEAGVDFLSGIFGKDVSVSVVRGVTGRILNIQSSASIPLGSSAGFISEWIVARPILVNGERVGTLTVPVRSDDMVGLYGQATRKQIRLWASLIVGFFGIMVVTMLVYNRWSKFLELEVARERELVRKTEGRYTALVEGAIVGVFEAKTDGEFTFVNRALAHMLGCDTPEELVGKTVLTGKQMLDHSGENPSGTPSASALKLKAMDRRELYVRLSCRTVKDPAGEVCGYEGFVEDTTEQYVAESRIVESERRYSSIFKLSPAGIFVTTPGGRILEINDSFAKIYGYESVEELRALTADVLYQNAGARAEYLAELRKQGFVRNKVSVARKKDGTRLYVFENTEIGFDPTYNEEVIRGVLVDVTEVIALQHEVEVRRRLAEATSEVLVAALEAERSPEFIDRSLKSIGVKLNLYATGVVPVSSDKAHIRRTWLSAEGQQGRGLEEAIASLGTRHRGGPEFLVYGRNDAAGGSSGSNGDLRSMSVAVLPVSIGSKVFAKLVFLGQPRGGAWTQLEKDFMSSIARLISRTIMEHDEAELRKGLEKMRDRLLFAFEQLAEAVVVSDVDGVISYVNSTFTKITGFTKEDVVGQGIEILRSDADGAEFYDRFWKTIMSGNVFKGRFKSRRKDGTLCHMDKTIAPVIDADERIVGFVEVSSDLTNLVSLEEQLAQAQKMESIGLLAGGIAHDFNNILGAILGYASFMKNDIPENHRHYKYVDTIERSAVRAAELTSQLLAFARGGKYNVRPVNLNRTVLDTLLIVQNTFDKSIVVEKDLARDLPTVEGDPGQLQQVVMNLAVNARDAMPLGGLLNITTCASTLSDAEAKVHIDATAGNYVALSVSDTGTGMDEATVRRIFEPFFTTKERGKGTGLGLSMVYGIVRNHGGFVTVDSKKGRGTTFRVYYPASSKIEKEVVEVKDEVRGGSETILLAEDEEAIRELVCDVLEGAGYKVITADDGKKSLEIYSERQNEIDLVILDMIMPAMNGEETFRRMKELNPAVIVLLSSGYSRDQRAQDLLNEGVSGFLGKPYQADELLRTIRGVLDKKLAE